MKNDGSTLDSILKKAGSFSEQIGKVHSLSKQLNGEKAALAEKEASLESDLLALIDTLYSFQQETISTLSEVYAKLQSKAEAKEKAPKKTEEPADFEVTVEPKKKAKPVEAEKKQQEEPADFEVAIEPEKKVKPKKEVKPKEKAAPKGQKEGEEVYLFDL